VDFNDRRNNNDLSNHALEIAIESARRQHAKIFNVPLEQVEHDALMDTEVKPGHPPLLSNPNNVPKEEMPTHVVATMHKNGQDDWKAYKNAWAWWGLYVGKEQPPERLGVDKDW